MKRFASHLLDVNSPMRMQLRADVHAVSVAYARGKVTKGSGHENEQLALNNDAGVPLRYAASC